MGARFTEIHLPNALGAGIGEWGELDAATAIERLRAYGKHLRAQADAIDGAADHEFQIQSYVGVHVQRKRREIQRSSRLETPAPAGASEASGLATATAYGAGADEAPGTPPNPSPKDPHQ